VGKTAIARSASTATAPSDSCVRAHNAGTGLVHLSIPAPQFCTVFHPRERCRIASMHNVEDIKGATKRFARAEARLKAWAMRSANAPPVLGSCGRNAIRVINRARHQRKTQKTGPTRVRHQRQRRPAERHRLSARRPIPTTHASAMAAPIAPISASCKSSKYKL
jgi:hypothetical protein